MVGHRIVLKQVTVMADDNRVILKPLSLTFPYDAQIGVLGRNGSGKTTLARLLSGLDKPTSGTITHRCRRVLQVLQRPEHHFTHDSVLREVAGYMRRYSDIRESYQFMDMVSLSRSLDNTSPRRLSGGQQRLLALACALAAEPDLLILDEPMAELDAESRQLVRTSLIGMKAARKGGLICISHHPDDLFGLVDQLWVMERGELIYQGKWRECPLEALDHCIDPADTSLFRWLRKEEQIGHPIPDHLYTDTNIPALLAVVRGDTR